MAFHFTYRGAEIRTDTAQEIQALIELFAQPAQLLLPPAANLPDVDDAGTRGPGRGARRQRAVRRQPRRGSRVGGGVAKTAPAGRERLAGAAYAMGGRRGALENQLLEAVRAGVSKPADLISRTGATKFTVRQVLKGLVTAGTVRVEGATMSRRYYPADSRRPAKEEPR